MTGRTGLAACVGVRAGSAAVVLAGCLLAIASQAQAGEICVANQSDFVIASTLATITPTTIKLVQGTYNIAGTLFDNMTASFQGFSLLGGYTANCASRQIDPDNTEIHVAASAAFGVNMIGDSTIEGVRFTGPEAGIGMLWDSDDNDIPASVQVTVRRNIISGGGEGIYLGWFPDGDQTLSARLVNNLIAGNAVGGFCAMDLRADEGTDATFTLNNNTIVDNTDGDGICMFLEGSLLAYNNILYGNTGGHDLAMFSGGATAFLVDNVIGTHTYQGIVTQIGTLTGDPQLDANFHPHESPPSPVINSGDNDVPGGLPAHDLDGGPRVVGSTVDRGAYESSINDAFLQTVTNNNDMGNGSLRAAIANVNAHDSGLITFDIGSGCGPHVITLNSNLPAIIKPVIINGYTQSGSFANDLDTGDDATICVILESGGSVTTGVHVTSNAGDSVQATIHGLAFSGFSDAGIDLQGGSGHGIAGNHFGGNVGGHALQPNGTDIRLGIATHDVIIGGDEVANRNIIGDAAGDGIVLQGAASGSLVIGTYNDQVLNNYVGVGWAQSGGNYTNRANGARGIHVLGHDNTVSGNLIGDNTTDGIDLDGDGAINNLIDGNFIGASAGGVDLGNTSMGVRAENDAHDNTIRSNTIANNGQKGVRIVTGRGNKIRKNSTYGNALLGIDLAAEGVTPNDDDGAIQPNDYANRGQNFPVLTGAAGGSHRGTVTSSLTTTPGDYTIDIYLSGTCDRSGYGEGTNWLKGATVTVPQPQVGDQGTVNFNIVIKVASPEFFVTGDALTTTATDAAGDTSEFSACSSYFDDTIFADGFESPPA